METDVYLSLGSNIGSREKNLTVATRQIAELSCTKIVTVSRLYETEPWGYTEQDSFLNMALRIKTCLDPLDLLSELQNIENNLKRTRFVRWGPRTIDIDILLYGDIRLDLPELAIPHPRMAERAFVLIPLSDIYIPNASSLFDIDGLISKCGGKEGVRVYKDSIKELYY